MGIGYSILVVATLVMTFFLYENIMTKRMGEYFERNDFTPEERIEESRRFWRDRMVLIFRLLIFGACLIAALFGDILGLVLTVVFTVEAFIYLYREARNASSKDKAAALTFLGFPFGVAVFCLMAKYLNMTILGIIVGIVLVALIRSMPGLDNLFSNLCNNNEEEEEEEERTTPKTSSSGRRSAVRGEK
ncbi:hypothetical protein IKG20_01785 [Candidatus Saccharibacteria bacterium]|nr:hypothetical protein [Candidatus Saccharibacteria bacterium]